MNNSDSDESFEQHIENSTEEIPIEQSIEQSIVEKTEKTEVDRGPQRQKKKLSKEHLAKMREGKQRWLEQKRAATLKKDTAKLTETAVVQKQRKQKRTVINNYYITEEKRTEKAHVKKRDIDIDEREIDRKIDIDTLEEESSSEEENNYYANDIVFV